MKKMIDPNLALELVLEHTPAPREREVPLADALGLVLAEAIHADRDYPPFRRAMMDGYAVRLEDAGRRVELVGEVSAGTTHDGTIASGQAVTIMTGAPCPPEAEAVVPVELVDDVTSGGALLPLTIKRGQHIVEPGTECRRGAVVAPPGTPITPVTLAAAAAVGRPRVRVYVPPTVAIVSTGNELVAPESRPGEAQIRDSNGPMLAAAARQAGAGSVTELHAQDTLAALADVLRAATAEVIIFSGGVSAGRYDLVPAALREIRAELIFHKVTQKPGKPLLFARLGDRLFFGLPGNPKKSHFCFTRYAAVAIQAMIGLPRRPPRHGRLDGDLDVSCSRTLFLPARLRENGVGLEIEPQIVGSGNIFACVGIGGYLRLEPGRHALLAGSPVTLDLA
jgi:molybdopterin molybdotransferase